MTRRYLVCTILAMALLLAACGDGTSGQPTTAPFNKHSAQNVYDAFTGAGITLQNWQSSMLVERDTPDTFSERYTFELASIAPRGGQVLIFDNPAGLQAWQDYIERLRNSSATRRTVIYVYVKDNVLLQLNADLPPNQAELFQQVLMGMA